VSERNLYFQPKYLLQARFFISYFPQEIFTLPFFPAFPYQAFQSKPAAHNR
jgi:hypothetical protein